MLRAITRHGLLLPLLAAMMLLIGFAAYLSGDPAATTDDETISLALPNSAENPAAALLATPSALLPPLDPTAAAVALSESEMESKGIQPSGAARPIGAFLPRTGNTRFGFLPSATIPPTLMVYPTSPPLPTLYYYPTPAPVSTTQANIPPTATSQLVATVRAFAAMVTPGFALPLSDCAPSGRPVDGGLTQYFHARHTGIDLSAPTGTPVQATHSGIITWADWNTVGYGNLVIIQSGPYITYYGHLSSFNGRTGDIVSKGAIIGFSGSTGNSTGPHVHYETRINDVPVDPMTFEGRGLFSC